MIRQRVNSTCENAIARFVVTVPDFAYVLGLTFKSDFLKDFGQLGVKKFWDNVGHRLSINRVAHTQVFFGGTIGKDEPECPGVFEVFQVPDYNPERELVNNASAQPDVFPHPTALLAGWSQSDTRRSPT